MKTIGLIGGMSWESTVSYYQLINETIKEKLGGLHSGKILLYSVDFAEIEHYQAIGDWDRSAQVLSEIAQKLELAGADFIVIRTNTMHKVAPQIKESISIPILHIAQATAHALLENGIKKVGLLGTKYTMTQDFYKENYLRMVWRWLFQPKLVLRKLIESFTMSSVLPKSKKAPNRAILLSSMI